MQTLLRDPAAGVMHSLIYFGFLVLLGGHHRRSRSTTRCPSSCKFLHGSVYEGVLVRRRRRRRSCFLDRHRRGRSCRRYVQRPYRIRIKTKPEHAVDPRHVPRHRRHRLPRPRRSASPLIGPARLREVVVRRLPARPRLVDATADARSHGWHQASVVVARRRLRRLPGDPADHDAAPHVHVAAEHVPARPRAPQGRHEADAQPDGDRARDASAPRPSRTSPGSSCSTPTPARCAAAARSVCPAHATGKPLDPREIVLKTGEVMAATGDPPVSPPIGVDPEITDRRRLAVRAHHRRGDLGVHVVQGVRRDLPGQHRDPRQDPRHAALPVADGVATSRPSSATPTGRWRTRATRGA